VFQRVYHVTPFTTAGTPATARTVNTGFSSPPVHALDHLFGPIVAMVSLMIFVLLVLFLFPSR
jgi:hypothetical protein